LDEAENYFVPEPRELGLNGSFAVFKMIETDVVGFENFLQSNKGQDRSRTPCRQDMRTVAQRRSFALLVIRRISFRTAANGGHADAVRVTEVNPGREDGLSIPDLRQRHPDGNMPALSAAESRSGTDVPTNNANERKRPPLDAGDLSQPYSKAQTFGPGTITTPVVLTSAIAR
jgi:hypothetical protein